MAHAKFTPPCAVWLWPRGWGGSLCCHCCFQWRKRGHTGKPLPARGRWKNKSKVPERPKQEEKMTWESARRFIYRNNKNGPYHCYQPLSKFLFQNLSNESGFWWLAILWLSFSWKTFKKRNCCLNPGFLVLTAIGTPLTFGNNQMAHSGPSNEKPAAQNRFLDFGWFWWLAIFKRKTIFCESWSPAILGNNQMAHSGR